jgi:two-component system LytT family response regulator
MAPPESRPAPLRALVVDDEALARRNVTILLRDDPDIASVTECESGLEAVAAIRASMPDLVFLDIQMPECDGFDVLELLGTDLPATTVFVTAYDEYALRAFDAGALDYLLKPFDDARFFRALSRAKAKLALYASVRARPAARVVVKSRGQVIFLEGTEIDWIEAAGYYACLHVGNDTHILRRTLAELEKDLGEDKFVRIHRSLIVNLERIRGLELQKGGEYEVVLKSKARLQLSRRFRKKLQDRLGLLPSGDG